MQQARDQRWIAKSFLERTLLDRFQILGRNPNVQPAIFFERRLGIAEREVLEDQFVMSAAGQCEPADEYNDHAERVDSVDLRSANQPSRPVLILANDTEKNPIDSVVILSDESRWK